MQSCGLRRSAALLHRHEAMTVHAIARTPCTVRSDSRVLGMRNGTLLGVARDAALGNRAVEARSLFVRYVAGVTRDLFLLHVH